MNAQTTTVTHRDLRVEIVSGNQQNATVGTALEPFVIRAIDVRTGEPIKGAKVDFIPNNAAKDAYLDRKDENDHTDGKGEMSATFAVETAGNPFTVACWVSCMQGSATISFAGTVRAQTPTIAYQQQRNAQPPAAEAQTATGDAAEMRASRVITLRAMPCVTLEPTPDDAQLDQKLFGSTDVADPSGTPIPSAPLPREAIEGMDETGDDEQLLEDASRESAVSHPDEEPVVPARSMMKRVVIGALALAAGILLYNVAPTFGATAKAPQRLCFHSQNGNAMTYGKCP